MKKLLIWIAFKLRLRQKFWADMFMSEYRKDVQKFVDSIELDTKDIKLSSESDESENIKKFLIKKELKQWLKEI